LWGAGVVRNHWLRRWLRAAWVLMGRAGDRSRVGVRMGHGKEEEKVWHWARGGRAAERQIVWEDVW